MLTPSQQPCRRNWVADLMKTSLLVLAGIFAVASMVLGFVGLLSGQGITPLALVSLLFALVFLTVFLAVRQRDVSNQ